MALTTWELVKAQCDFKNDAEKSFIQNQVIPAIQDDFEKELGFKIDLDDRVEIQDGKGSRSLYVRTPPIQTVSLLRVGSLEVAAAADITDSGYLFDANRIILTPTASPAFFPKGLMNVVVHFSSGWEEGDIPPGLTRAATKQCALEYLRRSDARAGVSSKSLGPTQTTSYITAPLLPDVAAEILRYRRVTLS